MFYKDKPKSIGTKAQTTTVCFCNPMLYAYNVGSIQTANISQINSYAVSAHLVNVKNAFVLVQQMTNHKKLETY